MDHHVIEPREPGGQPDPPALRQPPGELAAALRHAATRAVVLAAVVAGAALIFRELVSLLAAGFITLIFALLLSAVAAPLARRGVPRPLGALAGLLLVLGAVAGIAAAVVPTVVDQVQRLVDELPELAGGVAGQVDGQAGTGDVARRIQGHLQDLLDRPARLLGPLADVGLGVVGVGSALMVMVVTAYFIAARPQPLLEGALRLFPPDRRAWARHVTARIQTAWLGWMKGVVVDMLVTFGLLYLGLAAIGLDFAVLFAALSAVLVVVPYFGAIAGGIPPVLLGFAESAHLGVLVVLVYLAVQQIESNIIVPLVMSRMVELHPALIAVGIVVVAQLLGVVGLLVAVPILSAAVIAVDELWVRPQEARAGVALEVVAAPPGRRGRLARSLRARFEDRGERPAA